MAHHARHEGLRLGSLDAVEVEQGDEWVGGKVHGTPSCAGEVGDACGNKKAAVWEQKGDCTRHAQYAQATFDKIRAFGGYAYLASRGADKSARWAVYGVKRRLDRGGQRHGFAGKVHSTLWRSFPNLSGDALLLVPPRRLAATDLSDFVAKHGASGWAELVREAEAVWPPGTWLSTHGHGEPYLHLRFEAVVKYPPPSSAARL